MSLSLPQLSVSVRVWAFLRVCSACLPPSFCVPAHLHNYSHTQTYCVVYIQIYRLTHTLYIDTDAQRTERCQEEQWAMHQRHQEEQWAVHPFTNHMSYVCIQTLWLSLTFTPCHTHTKTCFPTPEVYSIATHMYTSTNIRKCVLNWMYTYTPEFYYRRQWYPPSPLSRRQWCLVRCPRLCVAACCSVL